MAFTFHVAGFAIRKSRRNLLRDLKRKGAVFGPMPETDWNIDIFQAKSPRLAKNFHVDDKSFDRGSPGAPLTFETRFKRDRIFQGGRIARL